MAKIFAEYIYDLRLTVKHVIQVTTQKLINAMSHYVVDDLIKKAYSGWGGVSKTLATQKTYSSISRWSSSMKPRGSSRLQRYSTTCKKAYGVNNH